MKFFSSRKTEAVLVAKMCSACGESLEDHAQVDIASAPIGGEDDERLAELITSRRWLDARRYQAANASTDIRAWRMIRCRDGRVGVVPFVMLIAMWSDNYYEEPQFLSEHEREGLLANVAQ